MSNKDPKKSQKWFNRIREAVGFHNQAKEVNLEESTFRLLHVPPDNWRAIYMKRVQEVKMECESPSAVPPDQRVGYKSQVRKTSGEEEGLFLWYDKVRITSEDKARLRRQMGRCVFPPSLSPYVE